ncbi:DegV family protein [Ruoffia tabacinasalis]|uniref:DegV family protein n=1 Tax=Ruoffia tabacinasalis TaxID=87458 RepID=A0A5R9DUW9_9LACT|nr:DegV family protein [Ruoffia tabacinasalis]TLQ39629.1 DegV family protein [Ruoffia tabacinasalis]
MKKWKIVVDSGSSIREIETTNQNVALEVVPLMINIGNEVFVDSADLDIANFLSELKDTKQKTSSACPSPEVYANRFEGAENVICFTISSQLSGSYNSASLGKDIALERNPDANIHIFDSRSAGSEMDLLAKKAFELAETDAEFDDVVKELNAYHENLDIAFLLESVDNLVNNGRVSKILGQMIGLLGIRLIGNRTPEGTIQLAHKSKGQKRALKTLINELKSKGYNGGEIEVSHVLNPDIAKAFEEEILKEYPNAKITTRVTSALCSYYAEHNGMIVGFETN